MQRIFRLNKKVLSFIAILFVTVTFTLNANAGWFGDDNWDHLDFLAKQEVISLVESNKLTNLQIKSSKLISKKKLPVRADTGTLYSGVYKFRVYFSEALAQEELYVWVYLIAGSKKIFENGKEKESDLNLIDVPAKELVGSSQKNYDEKMKSIPEHYKKLLDSDDISSAAENSLFSK